MHVHEVHELVPLLAPGMQAPTGSLRDRFGCLVRLLVGLSERSEISGK